MKLALTVISTAFCLCLFLTSCGEKEPASSAETSSTQGAPEETPTPEPESAPEPEETPEPAPEPEEAPEPAPEPEEAPEPTPEPEEAPEPTPEPEETPDPAANKPAAPASVITFTNELREKGVLELLEKLENAQEGRGENPMQMFDTMRQLNQLSDKLSTIDTADLPEDLKQPVNRFRDATADMATHMEEIPIPVEIVTGGQEAIGPWFVEKMAEDPLFPQIMEDWGRTMGELGEEMEESGSVIEKVFDAYDMNPFAP